MFKRILWSFAVVGCLTAIIGPPPAVAQVCGPLDNGRLANVFYEGTVVFFDPVVEFREMVLTISGPCETITHVFKQGEEISFDIREITKVTDGTYTWELRRAANVDPAVEKALAEVRGTGKEDEIWWSLFQKGSIPAGPYVDSASFSVERGVIIDPNSGEEKRASVASKGTGGLAAGAAIAGGFTPEPSAAGSGDNPLSAKDFVINDDLIVDGSACIGFDCVNGESFGFDTIRLKENNLRIKFDDTSTAASFPRNDWQLTANDSANGGLSKFSIDDITGSRTPFTVEAGAPSHSLYVDNGGRVGLGTSNPVLELHVVDGDTPAMRLQQDGSSGFASQTWDVAGNETNFFVRDVTSGSTLPFRIRPGAASSSLFIDSDSDVGIGTSSPSTKLHIRGVDAGSGNSLKLNFENTGTGTTWFFQNDQDNTFKISKNATGGSEITIDQRLDANGATLRVDGSVQATNVTFSSSRDLKELIQSVDPQEVLARLSRLPIAEWRFKEDPHRVRHIGPMAEDFHAAFPVGSSDKTISVTDASGITMAAVQGLIHRLDELETRNAELEERLRVMEQGAPSGE